MLEELVFFVKEEYFLVGYGITFLISLAYYHKYFDTVLKYFPILIAYTFLNELLGYLIRTKLHVSFFENLENSSINAIIYNIFSIIFFAYFYCVYWRLVSYEKYKRWILCGGMLVTVSYIVSCFFQNPKETDLFYATAIGSWVLVFCILLYFKDKKNRREKLVQSYNLMFWVSLALLIFYSIFPILYLIGYLDYSTWQEYNLKSLLRILIFLMYGTFVIGFVRGSRHSFG